MNEIKSKNVQNYVMNDMVFKVDLPRLLKEISECSKSTPYPVTFTILMRVLGILAERAIEIDDPALNIIMMNLGLYEGVHDKNADDWCSEEQIQKRGVVQISLYFLAKSLENMSLCHAVYFCKGWEKARGCKIEHDAAVAYGLEIIYEK